MGREGDDEHFPLQTPGGGVYRGHREPDQIRILYTRTSGTYAMPCYVLSGSVRLDLPGIHLWRSGVSRLYGLEGRGGGDIEERG